MRLAVVEKVLKFFQSGSETKPPPASVVAEGSLDTMMEEARRVIDSLEASKEELLKKANGAFVNLEKLQKGKSR